MKIKFMLLAAQICAGIVMVHANDAALSSKNADRAKSPVKIILDSDMISDYDDVGALACLHALADAGECEILATLSCTRANRSVAAIEIINGWYGRPNIPVGCAKGIGVSGSGPEPEAKKCPLDRGGHAKYVRLAKSYPQWVKYLNSDDAPDANEVYRRVLAAQPDHSVVICSIGFLTNLRRLLETKPDAVSPLDGKALVAKKVKLWVAMACQYPKGMEYNSRYDAESSAIALAEWPTPIAFSDFQYGKNVYTGRKIVEDASAKGPVKDIFAWSLPPRSKCTSTTWDRQKGHPSWDETAVLYAVRGAGDVFGVERGTYRMVGTDGSNVWTANPNSRDLRLVEKLSFSNVGDIIDELMCRKSKLNSPCDRECVAPIRPDGAAVALAGETLKPRVIELERTMTTCAPKFRRLGAVSPNGEASPFVFGGKLYRMELSDPTRGLNKADPCVHSEIREVASGRLVSTFGEGHYYPSVYVEGDRVYVTATRLEHGSDGKAWTGGAVTLFETDDLVHWRSRPLFKRDGWEFFNTTMTKGPDGYVIACESNHSKFAGVPFTMFFARSPDMRKWTFMDNSRAFPQDWYSGGPFLVWRNGWYYLSLVSELPCQRYCTYLYRTRDFATWEVGRYNPLLTVNDDDRKISPTAHSLDAARRAEIGKAFVCSAADLEMCDFEGKTYLVYGIGDQHGFYYFAEAWYDGPMDQLLENFFK